MPKAKCPPDVFETALPQPPVPTLALSLAALTESELKSRFAPQNSKKTQEELKQLQEELETIGKTHEELLTSLHERLATLKQWIADAFGITDIHSWTPTESSEEEEPVADSIMENTPETPVASPKATAETKEEVDSSAVIHSPKESMTSVASQAGSTNSKTEEVKPILRIKLATPNVPTPTAATTTATAIPSSTQATATLPSTAAPSAAPVPAGAPRGGTGSKNLSRMMSRPSEPDIKTKVANQTPVNIFWNYVEPYFKPLDDNDLRVLDDSGKFVDPIHFTIPPLGKHYEELWKEQYGYTVSGSGRSSKRSAENAGLPKSVTLRERLLAMLIEENLTVPESPDGEGSSGDTSMDASHSNSESTCATPLPDATFTKNCAIDHVHVEERIKQELTHSGLCMFVPKIDYQEDDAICSEIRMLQKRLREQVCLNHYRKRKLLEVVRSKMAAQELYTLLSDVNKQIEASFAKRNKIQKKKKRPTATPISGQASPAHVSIGKPSA